MVVIAVNVSNIVLSSFRGRPLSFIALYDMEAIDLGTLRLWKSEVIPIPTPFNDDGNEPTEWLKV